MVEIITDTAAVRIYPSGKIAYKPKKAHRWFYVAITAPIGKPRKRLHAVHAVSR